MFILKHAINNGNRPNRNAINAKIILVVTKSTDRCAVDSCILKYLQQKSKQIHILYPKC